MLGLWNMGTNRFLYFFDVYYYRGCIFFYSKCKLSLNNSLIVPIIVTGFNLIVYNLQKIQSHPKM